MTETETTTDETAWLEWRTHGIGASDIAAAHSGSYGGLYGVVASKLGYGDPDTIDPALADRGKRWEQPVADAVHALTGYYVHGEQAQAEHPDNPVWRCTLDGLLDSRPEIASICDAEALLETKTLGVSARWNMPYWETQCQWQMHVTGKRRVLLVVARIDDVDDTCKGLPHHDWIEYDPFTVGLLVDLAETIWGHVQAGTLPDPDMDTDPDDVKQVNMDAAPWTTSTGKETPDPETDIEYLDDQLARYLTVLEALKPLEAERTQLENLFRHEMGDGTTAESDTYRLRVGEPVHKFTSDSEADALDVYPAYAKIVLDRARFKTEEPDLYDAFKRPTTDRRITVKELRQ